MLSPLLRQLVPRSWIDYVRRLTYLYRFPGATIGPGVRLFRCRLEAPVRLHSDAYMSHSELGRYSYLAPGACLSHCRVGRFCSIGPAVAIGDGVHPSHDWVSTSPVFYSTKYQSGATFCEEDRFAEVTATVLEHDIWVGRGAIILPGITIHTGAIVGSGAVVTRDLAPYSVAVGVPARVIRQRFPDDQVQRLLKSRWWDRDEKWLRSNCDVFDHVNRFLEALENHPHEAPHS